MGRRELRRRVFLAGLNGLYTASDLAKPNWTPIGLPASWRRWLTDEAEGKSIQMSLALSLIGADTPRDHGLHAILPHALKSIARQGVALGGFRLGSVSVPLHYADNFTEGLA